VADLTKDEIRAELDRLDAAQPPASATRDELLAALQDAQFTALAVLPGDAVAYKLTAEHAAALSYREAKFARFVKGVAPFEPRVYSEGDAMYGRVFSSFDDGTATLDLLGSFPRFTLERVQQGDGVGQFRIKE
jgi:hypothetical protein